MYFIVYSLLLFTFCIRKHRSSMLSLFSLQENFWNHPQIFLRFFIEGKLQILYVRKASNLFLTFVILSWRKLSVICCVIIMQKEENTSRYIRRFFIEGILDCDRYPIEGKKDTWQSCISLLKETLWYVVWSFSYRKTFGIKLSVIGWVIVIR